MYNPMDHQSKDTFDKKTYLLYVILWTTKVKILLDKRFKVSAMYNPMDHQSKDTFENISALCNPMDYQSKDMLWTKDINISSLCNPMDHQRYSLSPNHSV